MKLTRRQFLYEGIAVALASFGTYKYLNNTEMKKAPKKPSMIISDLHCHPSRKNKLEDILDTLSNGLTGLTYVESNEDFLTYEMLTNLPQFKEIDKGIFGSITYNGKTGYVLKSQEIEDQDSIHVMALGCKEYLSESEYRDPRKAVEEIHKRGYIAQVNHPFIINSFDWARYKLINSFTEKEYKNFIELCQMADEIEIFNGHCIDLFPWFDGLPIFNRLNMAKANKLAEFLITKLPNKKGTASSDAHNELEQVHTSGIYLPDEHLCFDAIKEYIKTKNFEVHKGPISRWSFLKGAFPWLNSTLYFRDYSI